MTALFRRHKLDFFQLADLCLPGALLGQSIGLDVSSESALAAGVVMGIMIIPFVSSLADDAITAVPVAVDSLRHAASAMDVWLGLSWAAWSILWLMFFLLLALGKPIRRLTACTAIAEGLATAWLPGWMLLGGGLGAG